MTYELVDAEDPSFQLNSPGVVSGDIDRDGDIDVVATGRSGSAVLTNDGSGALSVDVQYGPSYASTSLVDVDGDEDLDLLSSIEIDGPEIRSPVINRNDGTGVFGPTEGFVLDPPGRLTDMVASDADRDGDIDVVAAFRVNGERHVGTYLNDGTGVFGTPTLHPLNFAFSDMATPIWLVAGDLDGDGDDDVVATDVVTTTTPENQRTERTHAAVALNDGTGAFTAAGTGSTEVGFTNMFWALQPALGDLDSDGNLDLAVGGPGSVTTLLGVGDGTFAAPQRSPVPNTSLIEYVTPADVDGDDHMDLVGFSDIAKATSGVVVYGNGAGGIDETHNLGTGTTLGSGGTPASDIEITDLDADADPDILFLAGSLGYVENVEGRPVHH